MKLETACKTANSILANFNPALIADSKAECPENAQEFDLAAFDLKELIKVLEKSIVSQADGYELSAKTLACAVKSGLVPPEAITGDFEQFLYTQNDCLIDGLQPEVAGLMIEAKLEVKEIDNLLQAVR